MSKGCKRRNENTAAVEANWPTRWNVRDDIVQPDGTVSGIDRTPSPYWHNRIEATSRQECAGPESERGDNGRHLATGLHKDCGASNGVTFSGPGSEEGAGHG